MRHLPQKLASCASSQTKWLWPEPKQRAWKNVWSTAAGSCLPATSLWSYMPGISATGTTQKESWLKPRPAKHHGSSKSMSHSFLSCCILRVQHTDLNDEPMWSFRCCIYGDAVKPGGRGWQRQEQRGISFLKTPKYAQPMRLRCRHHAAPLCITMYLWMAFDKQRTSICRLSIWSAHLQECEGEVVCAGLHLQFVPPHLRAWPAPQQ